MTRNRDVLPDQGGRPRVIMVEGVPWISHEFHELLIVEAQIERDRLRAENERLRAAADEAITTLALLRGHVEPGEAWDSEPWQAINACIRRVMQATGETSALPSDEVDALRANEPVTSTDEQEARGV